MKREKCRLTIPIHTDLGSLLILRFILHNLPDLDRPHVGGMWSIPVDSFLECDQYLQVDFFGIWVRPEGRCLLVQLVPTVYSGTVPYAYTAVPQSRAKSGLQPPGPKPQRATRDLNSGN
ncbi:hypothetical protein M8818_001188 [Zalaria obscura]|uniref:Uncharacterized protein n=1 Tax=Zalaria obscura TaxID=2024903 RepID=A0ACC3SKH3_9PEZI